MERPKPTQKKTIDTNEFRRRRLVELFDPIKNYQRAIASALPRNYYQGTDDPQKLKALAKRRAKNKMARLSRRKNRVR